MLFWIARRYPLECIFVAVETCPTHRLGGMEQGMETKAYPHMLVTTGYWDSQVQYWEPAKWVAKLRDMKTDKNKLYMDCNMAVGHGGASGRFERLKRTALEYAFLLTVK